jgi:hypothetical protein
MALDGDFGLEISFGFAGARATRSETAWLAASFCASMTLANVAEDIYTKR